MLFYKIRALFLGYTLHGLAWALHLQLPPKVSAAAFIEKEGKYLVLHLTYRKGYGFPGGILEGAETLEAGLAREVFEETGLIVTSAKYITSRSDIQYHFPVLVAAFSVSATGTLTASKEGALDFKPPQEILDNCSYPNVREAFRYYLDTK